MPQPLEHTPGVHGAPRPPRHGRGLPLFGSLAAMAANPVAFFADGYARHGPVFRIRLLHQQLVVLAGAEANHWLVRHERDLLTSRGQYDAISRLQGSHPDSIITNVDGDRHDELRRAYKHGMSKKYLEARLETASAVGRRFFDALPKDAPLDATRLCKQLVFQQLGHTLTGEAPDFLFDDILHLLNRMIAFSLLPALELLPRSRKTQQVIARLNTYGRDLKERLLAEDRPCLQTNLFRDQDRGVFKEEDLALLVVSGYVGGLDTLAHVMSFALHVLVSNEPVRQRVQAELDAHFDPEHVTVESLARLEKTRHALMESMRVHPLIPGLPRIARTDFVLDGHQIRKGDRLLLAATVSHFDDRLFPRPHEFDLDRFSKGRREHRQPGAYQPYGVGEHFCLGSSQAELQLLLNVALLFRRWHVACHDERYTLRTRWLPVAHPVGFDVVVRPRPLALA